MKLIDILVAELPKRGGWPESNMTKYNDILIRNKITYCTSPDYSFFEDLDGNQVTREQYEAALAATKERKMNWKYIKGSEKDFVCAPSNETHAFMHKECCHFIYTSNPEDIRADLFLFIAQREPVAEWDGVGLPPVGCIARLHGIKETTHLQFKHSDHCQVNLWRNGDEVEVISVKGKDLAVAWHEESKTACGVLVKFLLPIKSEADKKRDNAIDNFIRELILCVDLNAPMVDGNSKVASKLYELLPTLPGVNVDIK